MNEFDNPKSGAGTEEKAVKMPRAFLILFSGIEFAFAIVATVLVWLLYTPFPGIAGCISFFFAALLLTLLAMEPAFKGKNIKVAFLFLSAVSVLLCAAASPTGFFQEIRHVSGILLCVNTGFSGLLFVSLLLYSLLAKLRPVQGEAAKGVQEEVSPLEVKTQDVSPARSKDKVVLLSATYNKGIGFWTNICQGFANFFGCKCKHYDKKVNIALSEIEKSLLLKISSYPDYDFSSFHIASDGRLSFTGSVLGVKMKKED